MSKQTIPLKVIDGETLMDTRLTPARFCVDTLLPQGVTVLGGAPKTGKSWLVLDLCLRVAKGEPLWNLNTAKGAVLYLCLEDTEERIQKRLYAMTDDVPPSVFFSMEARPLESGLTGQIRQFVTEHPDTVLVAIDTLQMVRRPTADCTYANDYQEILAFKQLADELKLSLLLVHHLRKQGDSDPLNKLSGTTALTGAADAVLVLEKSRRSQSGATLTCTGRDIEHRELELKFSKDACLWELEGDSLTRPELLLPKELEAFLRFMEEQRAYSGGNSELASLFCAQSGVQVSAKALKQMMNQWWTQLEAAGLYFNSRRSNGQRLVDVWMQADGDTSAVSDAETAAPKTSAPSVPCVTDGADVPFSPPFAESGKGRTA